LEIFKHNYSGAREIIKIFFASEREEAVKVEVVGIVLFLAESQDLVGEVVLRIIGGIFGEEEAHEIKISNF
jgi:hypothetical protein